MLLLRALAGSRLYGTSRPDSDWDWYEVHDHIRPRQKIVDDQDVTRMDLSTWMRYAEKGTHQALDAMWCPPELTEVDVIRDLRLNFRPDPWRAADQLHRTARSMMHSKTKHVDRLMWCAEQVLRHGYYNPAAWKNHLDMIDSQ